MAFLKIASRFALVLAVAAMIVALAVPVCRAEDSQLLSKEPWVAPTGHPVQDTIGRGLDFVLRPVYIGGSQAFFFVYKPPVMRHITTIRREEAPAPEQQPQAQEAPEQTPQEMQPQAPQAPQQSPEQPSQPQQ